tara:strand:- start:168 stop:335 length:168 start_codon:yes stop_codon:yes gene_type:complete
MQGVALALSLRTPAGKVPPSMRMRDAPSWWRHSARGWLALPRHPWAQWAAVAAYT